MNTATVVSVAPSNGPKVRRVVVVPSLWAPFHHRRAVAALTAFAATAQPDWIVFMNAPGDLSIEACEAFMNVLTAFRVTYGGPIAVHSPAVRHTAVFARLNVATLPETAPVAPGWRAVSVDLTVQPDMATHAAAVNANLVCGVTGRLRLAGRAVSADNGTIQGWLVFECGTLAADLAAGTLGFGILETDETTTTARPVRIGPDGSFTYRGSLHEPP